MTNGELTNISDITISEHTITIEKQLHNNSITKENQKMVTLDSRKKAAIDALAKLAVGMDGKSETAKIREVIDSVELALSSGVHREKVFDTLRESLGIKMNFRTFETTLHRIRKERKQKNIAPNNVYPIQIETLNTGNQMVPYSSNEYKNTDPVVISSESKSMMDMDLANEKEKDEENWEPESSELEFRNRDRKVDTQALEKAAREFKDKLKEKEKEKRRKF